MSSDSPVSESPTTPQQTMLSPTASTKKARRQTAFYPNVNSSNKPQNPFSRSAAKRESVMALGSIEHLQHYFTKTGLSAKKNPLKPGSNAAPAIGPNRILTDVPSSAQEPNFILPPSPMIPPTLPPSFPPFVKTYQTDPEILKPGVIEDLEAVERVWGIGGDVHQPRDPDLLGGGAPSTSGFDVLSALKTTTRTIRSVRNYLVALPDDFSTQQHAQFRPHSLSPPTGPARKVSQPDAPEDSLTLVRRSALQVLTELRKLEEVARIPLSDDVYDAQSDAGSTSTRSHTPGGTERVASPFTTTSGDDDEESTASFSFSVVKAPRHKNSVPVWSDEEESDPDEDATEKRERWDERLVLGGGWLYKQDMSPESLQAERQAVERYLDAVDQVLFGGQEKASRRGWEKEKERLAAEKEREARVSKSRRSSAGDGEGGGLPQPGGRTRRIVSAGMVDAMRDMMLSEEPDEMLQSVAEEAEDEEEVGVEDSLLPDWAKRSRFADDPLAQTLSVFVAFLPPDLLRLLPSPDSSSRGTVLLALSSGQILCTVYNAAVRKSRKPWGYINRTAIHDIATLEAEEIASGGDTEKRKKGWTFRRTDNLRLWAAALKLRYLLPLVLPRNAQGGTPMTSPSATQVSFPTMEPPLFFDPQLVARREEGWETMLEAVVFRWIGCIVDERRKGR